MEHRESGRHLAAILFTDIVGYTSMMQRDEAMALAAVRRHQEVLESQVRRHEGEIYQYYGDGSLSIFHSAIQAVKAALEIQSELQKEPLVNLRIGIHIGEIYTEGGKIFGDGVNIASRIESIGQAGTVLFSRDVFEKIRNHNLFQIKPVGKFDFKNVDDPVEVFALTNPEVKFPDTRHVEGKLKETGTKKKSKWAYIALALVPLVFTLYVVFATHQSSSVKPGNEYGVKQSIAVLPFSNISEGKEEDFLGVGIATDILTQLSQIHNLKVISGASSMRYKDTDKPIKVIGKDLDVTSILSGSIRKYENNLRVSVQLTNVLNESLVWAADFDRKFEDVLNMQRDVALAVSEKLKVTLTPQLETRFKNKVIVHPEAYINFQKGQQQLLVSNGTREDVENAMAYFQKSISLDSNFAKAWVGLADANTEGIFWHRIEPAQALTNSRYAARKAMEIDPQLGEAYAALGSIEYIERNFVEAEKNLGQAIEFSPNYSFAYERLGWILIIKNEVDEAMKLFYKAIELDPLSTRLKGSIGNSLALTGQYEEGILITKKYLEANPLDNYLLWTLGFLYARDGKFKDAIETLNKRSIGTKTNWVLGYAYAKTGQREKAIEILNNNLEKQKTEIVPDFMMAVQYAGLGDKESALSYLQKGIYNQGESFFIVALDKDPFFELLYDDPRFKKVVSEIKGQFKMATAPMK